MEIASNVRTNKLMAEILSDIDLDGVEINNITTEKTDFVEWDGCILLTTGLKTELPEKFVTTPQIPDRTSYEALYNHLHLGDNKADSEIVTITEGLRVLFSWENSLNAKFPTKKFHLVLSSLNGDVVIRFYQQRENEEPWLNLDALDEYKEERIFVLV